MKLAKKILATLLAVTMLLGVFSVVSFADWTDEGVNTYNYQKVYMPWFNGTINPAVWAGRQADTVNFTTFTGSDLAAGTYSGFAPATSYNTFFMTFVGGDYGSAGVKMNGFGIIVTDEAGAALPVSAVEGKVDVYVNANTSGSWNNWKKVEISSIDAVTINGLGSFVFWFDAEYTSVLNDLATELSNTLKEAI